MTLSTSPASVPSVTEREAVLREREAATWAAHFVLAAWGDLRQAYDGDGRMRAKVEADIRGCVERSYPLPKIAMPLRGTFSDGTVAWWETGSDNFRPSIDPHIEYEWGWDSIEGFIRAHVSTPVDVQILARMLSGETETVEDDQPSLDHPHERHGVDQ